MAKVYNNLDAFILIGKSTTITYQKTSFCDYFQDIEFPMYNVIWDYINELKEEAVPVLLTDKQFDTYKYKPRLLSMYLYGSTEFFFIILALNDMASEKEFTKNTVTLLPADKMKNLLEKIYTSEKASVESYSSRMKKQYEEENYAG